MRILLVIILTISVKLSCQNIKVIDLTTKLPIYEVTLVSEKNKKGTTTDINGEANLKIFSSGDIIKLNHIGYKTKEIKIKKENLIIKLSPKSFILPEVVFSDAPKWIQSTSNMLEVKRLTEMDNTKKSTTAILSNAIGVNIQSGQSGGGSPNFRGLEANRLLLVLDGVSLNSTIFRSGHLQNSATISPYFIEKIALLTGPGAISFGDGALANAIVFKTLAPSFTEDNKLFFSQHFESSSNLTSLNVKMLYGNKRIANITGFSAKSADNLRMGSLRLHGYENWGNESISTNENEQLHTSFNQLDFIHKSLIKTGQKKTISLNTQYSITSKINRFDKLNDYEGENQKYSTWHYGPQSRFMQIIKINSKQTTYIYDQIETILSFQKHIESRHKQKHNDSLMSNRFEKVSIIDIGVNLNKRFSNSIISYGLGCRKQFVKSKANFESENGTLQFNTTRYPSGGTDVLNVFSYCQATIDLSNNLKFYLGLRGNYNKLNSLFEGTSTYNFPFSEISTENNSLVGSSKIRYQINDKISIFSSLYSGFRNPNLDDIGKVFSKNNNYVVVPNENLKAEESRNLELGLKTQLKNKNHIRFLYYNTKILNAIIRSEASINGQDSILYDGEVMKVQMNKNVERAIIYGYDFDWKINLFKDLNLTSKLSFIKGRDSNNEPLSHIHPTSAKIEAEYVYKNKNFVLNIMYNGWKKTSEYSLSGVDNLDEATSDGNPSWYIINLSYRESFKKIIYRIGVENLLDIHYKTFSSGLSASGRNFTLSLHFNL